ncbi:MAG: NBR1-Ig-like domain-containing protein [Chloroflexota bacterium]
MRNTGDAPWDIGYGLGFVGDDQMLAPDFVPVSTTQPGNTAELSVTLRAPDAPGVHRSTWRMRDATGEFFGDFYYAEITIEQQADLEAAGDSAICLNRISSSPLRVSAGEQFLQTWTLCNTGRTRWNERYTLAFAGDHRMGAPVSVLIPPTPPGENSAVSVRLTAPARPGHYRSSWQPRIRPGNDSGR